MTDTVKYGRVAVTGDLVVDHNLYKGERPTPRMIDRRGVQIVTRYGGAAGLFGILRELLTPRDEEKTDMRRDDAGAVPEDAPAPEAHPRPLEFWYDDRLVAEACHAFAIWQPLPRRVGSKERPVWRADLLGYGDPDGPKRTDAARETDDGAAPPEFRRQIVSGMAEAVPGPWMEQGGSASSPAPLDLLVLDDGGQGFRKTARSASWKACLAQDPRWILLKMSAPIGRNDLWHELIEKHGDRLICLVAADDIRREQVRIDRGLSWERTLNDLRRAIRHDAALSQLRESAHLVVVLANDAALWIEKRAETASFVFDPGGIEGAWQDAHEGDVTGYMTVMAAALAHHAAVRAAASPATSLDLRPALQAGLHAMRWLNETGHGDLTATVKGYPEARIAEKIREKSAPDFAELTVEWCETDAKDDWMLLESDQSPAGFGLALSTHGLARSVMVHGRQNVLSDYPHAVFGKLTVIDRGEIEALRGIRALMRRYHADRNASKPLSIGVFGPPGAGKSFGVKQLAREVFGETAWLEFNLSQLTDAKDLTGPFHQIRDIVLRGTTPVVFWDEFDSKENAWLQFLLAPMQDGRFQDGDLNHAIGKAVFVFAGGTCPTFAQFTPQRWEKDREDEKETKAFQDFRLRKGPDFVSRLDAFYDVVGPNPREFRPGASPDLSFPLRRALLLREIFAEGSERRVEIDSDLLDALLLTRRYHHGSRSLEKLARMLSTSGQGPILSSALPTPERLRMLVDDEDFLARLGRNAGFRQIAAIDVQAEAIHEGYRAHMQATGEEIAEPIDRPYAELAPIHQEGNREAFQRTVDVLAHGGLGVAPKGSKEAERAITREAFAALLDRHGERLCEAEHEGWMAHRIATGWQPHDGVGRDFHLQRHAALKPYARLGKKNKDKDRLMVGGYWDRVDRAGFAIVPLIDPKAGKADQPAADRDRTRPTR